MTPLYWFGSDHHHGHRNIIGHMDRPFQSLDDMDERMIEDHNDVVRPQDIVYFLGDFSFYNGAKTSLILSRMHGQKNLILGNHDHSKIVRETKGWNRVLSYLDLKVGSDRFVLSHFPFLSWHQMHRGAYHLHGHSHGSLKYPFTTPARILDVGVDVTYLRTGKYRPVFSDEVVGMLQDFGPISVDHHKVVPGRGVE